MDAETLFVNVYEEMRGCSTLSEQDGLRASALLRQLLLDERPLMLAVNRAQRLRIRFRVPPFELPEEGAEPRTASCDLVALQQEFPLDRYLTLEEFLSLQAVYIGGHRVTVRECIHFSANLMGGVHLGVRTEGVAQQAMKDWYDTMDSSVASMPTMYVHNIAGVVLRDLRDLYEAVKEIAPGQQSRSTV